MPASLGLFLPPGRRILGAKKQNVGSVPCVRFLVAAFVFLLLSLWAAGGSVVYTAVAFLTATTFGTCLLFGVLGEAVIEGATGARSRKALFHEWKGA